MSDRQIKEEQNMGDQVNSLSSLPLIQSRNSINADNSEKRREDEDLEEVVMVKKQASINAAEILKFYQMQEEEVLPENTTQKKKGVRYSQTLKKGPFDDDENRKQENISKVGRIRHKITNYISEYRSSYQPSIYDTEMQRFRYECKQKLFMSCCEVIEELKLLNIQELSAKEIQIVKMAATVQNKIRNEIFYYCKSLTRLIDLTFLKQLNKNYKGKMNSNFRNQWNFLIDNICDDNNIELRRKVITQDFPVEKMASASEREFFTTDKREQIMEREKIYIAEMTEKQISNPMPINEEEEMIEKSKLDILGLDIKEEQSMSQTKAKKYKYIDESSISMLEDLLSDGQLQKMKKRLEEDLKGESKTRLLKSYHTLFSITH